MILAHSRRAIPLAFAIAFGIGFAPNARSPALDAQADGAPREAPFLRENEAAMRKMMAGMTVKPTENVDLDFVAAMAPHHQGAIDMAQTYLRYGDNEQLKRLAQEIIVTQQQEIAAMYLAVGLPLPPSLPAPDQPDARFAIGGGAPPHGISGHPGN